MFSNNLLIFLLFFLNGFTFVYMDSFILTQVIFRHGDRTPVYNIPGDNNTWQDLGKLTEEGIRRSAELGRYLRKTYDGFISNTYEKNEVRLESTATDRTLMSGEAALSTFYGSSPDEKELLCLDFHPTPLYLRNNNYDILFHNRYSNCPKFIRYNRLSLNSSVFNEWRKEIDHVLSHTDQEITVLNFFNLISTLYIEKNSNKDWPSWVSEELFDRLWNLKGFIYHFKWGRPSVIKYLGGICLERLINDFTQRLNKTSQKKLLLVSGHVEDVAFILMVFNVFNNLPVPYSACVMIELHEKDCVDPSCEKYFVQIYYRNETGNGRHLLTIPGCTSSCPWNLFINLTSSHLPDDWNTMCEDGISSFTNLFIVFIVIATSTVILIVIFLFVKSLF